MPEYLILARLETGAADYLIRERMTKAQDPDTEPEEKGKEAVVKIKVYFMSYLLLVK